MKLTGAEIFVECLKREGVKTIFGLPGGVVLKIIKEAFYIAMTGRPGPVLVDIPKDVAMNKGEFHYPDRVSIRGYNPTYEGNKWQIKQAVEAIHKARKPIIYVGGGAIFSNAHEELLEFAELTQIPVDMTLMALGAFPGSHPLSLGMMGMHGSYA